MKLAIGINIFGNSKRQNHCIDVLKKLCFKKENINLYNITFENEKNDHPEFIHLPLLKTKAKDTIDNSISQKPIVKQFFDILSDQNSDYFLFLNSDILISNKLLKLIFKKEYDTYCFSRHDIYEIDDYESPVQPFRIEIAGFDAWVVKNNWWKNNNNLFKNYVYAEHLWDVDYTLTMYNNSNCCLCNKEFYIAHEKHQLNWNEHSLEAQHNSNLWEKTQYPDRWKKFIYENLVFRLPHGQFLNPLENEKFLENQLLKIK